MLETIAPVVQAGLQRAVRGARLTVGRLSDAFAQDMGEASLTEPQGARLGPPGRERFRTTLVPQPERRIQLRGLTIGAADPDVVLAPTGDVFPSGEDRPLVVETERTQRIPLTLSEAASFQDPLAAGAGVVDVLRAEREAFGQFTEPAGRFVAREAAEAQPAVQVLEAARRVGAPVPDIPAVAEEVGGAVIPELALLSNIVPLPFIDPALARLLSLTVRTGTRVSRPFLEGLSRRIAALTSDPVVGNKARDAVGEIGRLLSSERGALDVEPLLGILDDATIAAGQRAGARDIVGSALERRVAALQGRQRTALARTDPTAPSRPPGAGRDLPGEALERLGARQAAEPVRTFERELGQDFPRRVRPPTERPFPRREQDIVGEALEALPERRLAAGLGQDFPPRPRLPVTRPVRRREMDATGEALQRLSGEPDRVMPPTIRRREIALEEFETQAQQANEAFDRARERLVFARRAVRDQLLPQGRLEAAKTELAEARSAWHQARNLLNETEIRVSIDDIVQRARAAGADDVTTDILEQGYRDTLRLVAKDEPLLTRSAFMQRVARVAAAIQGTPPGTVGAIANQRHVVETVMRHQTAEELDRIATVLDRLFATELDDLEFVVPGADELKKLKITVEELTAIATGEWKDRIVVQHPDWYRGKSPDLRVALEEAQIFQRGKLAIAEAMGYPIKAIDRPYLEQLWEVPRSVLEVPIPRIPGKVSVAKERAFGDYVEGIRAGLTPRDMSIGELIEHSSYLMDEAIADSFERRLVLERFGTKGRRPIGTGLKPFGHPLYQGWSAPAPITNFVDQLHNPQLPGIRALSPIAQAIKGTVFGVADIGVFGTHLLDALTAGGPRAFGALINRSLRTMQLPHANIWLDENLPIVARHGLDGVNQGMGPSAVTLKGGTIAKYIPFIGEQVDKPISAAVDALARVQFGGILRPIRNVIYEGNLLSLHLTGSDITDAAVRRTAADNANAWTGASRGAQTRGRRGLESVGLTSFQMTRSEMARLGQIAKALGPTAAKEERILAAITLASFGGMVYGIGSAINMALGRGPLEFNPARGNWASIEVGGEVVPLVSRRALIRAIGKSFDVLRRERPEDIARIWAQFGVAKLNPGTSPVQSALGFGFEEGGRFQAGTLSARGRILNMAPMPPVLETVVTEPEERRPLRLGLEAAGFGAFPVSAFKRLNRAFKEETGRDYDGSEAARRVAEASDTLRPFLETFDKESRERGFAPAIKREERGQVFADLAEALRPLVEGVRAGDPRAGQQFRDEFSTLKAQAFAISLRDVLGVDFPDPDTELGRLVEQYHTTEPQRDPETFQMDWATFDRERDAILAKIAPIAPEVADALQTRLRLPEEFRDVEEQYQRAATLRDQLGDKPRYVGLRVGDHDTVRRFLGAVDRQRNIWSENGHDVELEEAIRIKAQDWELPQAALGWALCIRSSQSRCALGNRNPEYDQFIIDNRAELELFYPNLITDRIREQMAAVP